MLRYYRLGTFGDATLIHFRGLKVMQIEAKLYAFCYFGNAVNILMTCREQ